MRLLFVWPGNIRRVAATELVGERLIEQIREGL
ncbi:hypothetical protein SAMN05216201_103167 [Pseudomonas linyingensis]|uniref:Uncharacterized protein n=1 Tax=Pseudomonas linyingensis TaxID=915471 RepID=A0A1H6UNE8_9PSED|nr:hypothetical protein SAMN05216201_103167 [Pseudomonas linyingensis]